MATATSIDDARSAPRPADPGDWRGRLYRREFRARMARPRALARWSASTSSPTPAISTISPASADDPRHVFVHGDIGDAELVDEPVARSTGRAAVVNFAAEIACRPLDPRPRAISSAPTSWARSACWKRARAYCDSLGAADKAAFRFLHVSTDEVFGSLAADEPAFTETTPLCSRTAPTRRPRRRPIIWCAPGSHTYGLPVLITNCSNNYGPYQFPEKLIPLMIHQRARTASRCRSMATAGSVRDWLYVDDHCAAIRAVLARGRRRRDLQHRRRAARRPNLEVVEPLCDILDAERRAPAAARIAQQIDIRRRPARPRPPLCDRRRARSSANSAGRRRRRFDTGIAQDRALVSRQRAMGRAFRQRLLSRLAAEELFQPVSGATRLWQNWHLW